ncbi:MAG: ABC transporter permease subunit [Lachnospiraceae bacterium]|nr:ABC transporter permease subunit [Lachnospiraceae bacterium]
MIKNNKLAIASKVLKQSLIYFVLIIVAIIVVYPLLWIIGTSFNPTNSISRISPIPENATLANYTRLLRDTEYIRWFINTGYVAVITSVCAVFVHTLTAFIFARFNFKGRKAGLLCVMLLQVFPAFMAVTAYYMIALTFNMLNNLNMLVIIYVATTIPINVWLIKGNLMNLPKSFDEAAYIDGATKLQVFFKIILPLSAPIISFVALISFMMPWMDYMIPRFLINRAGTMTVALGLYEMVRLQTMYYDFTAFCAGAVIIAIPIAIIYMIGQKYLIAGFASGANKGE